LCLQIPTLVLYLFDFILRKFRGVDGEERVIDPGTTVQPGSADCGATNHSTSLTSAGTTTTSPYTGSTDTTATGNIRKFDLESTNGTGKKGARTGRTVIETSVTFSRENATKSATPKVLAKPTTSITTVSSAVTLSGQKSSTTQMSTLTASPTPWTSSTAKLWTSVSLGLTAPDPSKTITAKSATERKSKETDDKTHVILSYAVKSKPVRRARIRSSPQQPIISKTVPPTTIVTTSPGGNTAATVVNADTDVNTKGPSVRLSKEVGMTKHLSSEALLKKKVRRKGNRKLFRYVHLNKEIILGE
jgi:hypothetical protein